MNKFALALGLLLGTCTLMLAQPVAPTSFTASTLSATGVALTWTDASSNETGFQIERSLTSGSGYTLIATTAANATSYINTGLLSGRQYFYRIRATNAGGSSAYTAVATASTGLRRFLIDFGSPTVQTSATTWNNVTTSATGTTVNLIESSGAASSLNIQITKDPSNGYGAFSSNGSNVVVLDYPVSAVSDGHYGWQSGGSYRLNGLDNSKAYNLRMFSSRLYVGDPRRSIFTINGQQLILEAANNTSQTILFTNIVPTAGSITINLTVASGSAFGYLNVLDVVEMSVAPQTPASFSATSVSPSQINLGWVDGSSNETGFQIERSTTAGSNFALLTTTAPNVINYSDTDLLPGTTYYYRIRANGEQGNSGFSSEVNATTLIPAPAAPTGLTADAFSTTQIDLTWIDNATNETSFQIERSLTQGGSYTLAATVPANSTSWSNTGLPSDTRYFYRVRAVNAGGNSPYSEEAAATTLLAPPLAPGTVMASVTSPYQIQLTWIDRSGNEASFVVERSVNDDLHFEVLETVDANTTDFTDTTVAPATLYYYRVAANNAAGSSSYAVAMVTTPLPPPAAPTSLSATAISSSEIDLAWIDQSDNESSFLIQRSTATDGAFVTVATVDADLTFYKSTALNSATTYVYRVQATNSGGSSAFSESATATTFEGPPAAPGNLSVSAITARELTLTWTDNSVNETGFEIERSLTAQSGFLPVATTAADARSWTDTTLEPGTLYYFRVRATNSAGSSAYDNASVTTLPLPPAVPGSLSVSATSPTRIDLNWIDSSDNETEFQVERSTLAAPAFVLVATLSANITTWADNNLSANTLYSYRIRALNTGGSSPYSDVASTTTLAAPPSAPTSLTATSISPSQINLTWTDASNNETGFEVERSLTAATGFASLGTVGANTTVYSDGGLSESTRYYYRVRAINDAGASANTPEATATTQSTTQPYGTIFNETSFASATRFPIAGTGIARGTNKLTMTGNPTLFTSYIYHDDAANPFRYTCLENWKVRARVKTPSTLNSTTYGIGIGVQSTNTADPYSTTMRWSWETGGNQVYLYYKSSISLQMVSTTKYVPAANTYYWVEVTRAKDSFTYTVFDGTNGTTQLFTAKLTFPTFTSGNYVKAHNTGQFCIHQFGGNNEVTNWEVSTSALKNADFLGLGDSNMHGMFATNNAGRWIESAMTTAGKSFNILAGISDRTSDVIKRLPEVIALKPRVVVLSIGRNDLAGSVSLTTVQNNIDNIINTLQSNGITVYLAGVIASNINVSSLQTYYNNKPNVKINAYTATKAASATTLNTSLSSGDAIHLNQAGNTALANLLLTIILPQTPPVAPANLTASATSSSAINLSWTDNSNNETGFQVERSQTSGSGYSLIATTSPNATSYSSTGLVGNTTYYYRVRAVNVSSNSAYTNEASATTPAVVITPPSAPTNLAALSASSTQVNLTWTDASSNETGFQVERSLTSGSGFSLIATLTPNTTSYSDVGLVANTTYYYRVRAINDGGSSAYTTVVSTTTQSGVVNPGGRRFLIDFGSPSTTTTVAGWNNITAPTTGSVTNLIQSTGAGSTLSGADDRFCYKSHSNYRRRVDTESADR